MQFPHLSWLPRPPGLGTLGSLGRPWEPAWGGLASGSPWEPLGAPGSPWEPLGAPGSPWEPLGAPGSPWEPLGAPGSPWEWYFIEFFRVWRRCSGIFSSFYVFLAGRGARGSPERAAGEAVPNHIRRPGRHFHRVFACFLSGQVASPHAWGALAGPGSRGSLGLPGQPGEARAGRGGPGGGPDRPSGGPWIGPPFLLRKLHYSSSFHGFLPPRETPLPRTP